MATQYSVLIYGQYVIKYFGCIKQLNPTCFFLFNPTIRTCKWEPVPWVGTVTEFLAINFHVPNLNMFQSVIHTHAHMYICNICNNILQPDGVKLKCIF